MTSAPRANHVKDIFLNPQTGLLAAQRWTPNKKDPLPGTQYDQCRSIFRGCGSSHGEGFWRIYRHSLLGMYLAIYELRSNSMDSFVDVNDLNPSWFLLHRADPWRLLLMLVRTIVLRVRIQRRYSSILRGLMASQYRKLNPGSKGTWALA